MNRYPTMGVIPEIYEDGVHVATLLNMSGQHKPEIAYMHDRLAKDLDAKKTDSEGSEECSY